MPPVSQYVGNKLDSDVRAPTMLPPPAYRMNFPPSLRSPVQATLQIQKPRAQVLQSPVQISPGSVGSVRSHLSSSTNDSGTDSVIGGNTLLVGMYGYARSARDLLNLLEGCCSSCVLLFNAPLDDPDLVLHQMGQSAHHQCGRSGLRLEEYMPFRSKTHWESYTCCFSCRLPQPYCNGWESKVFDRNACSKVHRDTVLPVVWLFYQIGQKNGWETDVVMQQLWMQLPELHQEEILVQRFLSKKAIVNKHLARGTKDQFKVNALWLVFVAIAVTRAREGQISCPSLLVDKSSDPTW